MPKTYVQPLHQSSISTCLGCKRCFMYRDRWCLKPKKKEKAGAANQGHITHRLLQKGPDPDGVSEVWAETSLEIAKALAHVEKGEDLLGEWAMRATLLDQMYGKALAICTILWEKHPQPDTHITLGREEPASFLIRLGEPGDNDSLVTEIAGTLDHIILDTVTDKIYIRDYKSSSRDPLFTTTGYQWSLQCRLYRLLAGAYLQQLIGSDGEFLYKGRHIDGFVLDVLQVPMISLCGKDRDYDESPHTFKSGKRKGETEMRREYFGQPKFENYLQRCKEWYTLLDNKEPIQSSCILFTENSMPPELRADLRIAAVYQNVDAVPENFPRDETTRFCKNYERQCIYYDLCSSDPLGWDEIIEQKYDVVVPDDAREVS